MSGTDSLRLMPPTHDPWPPGGTAPKDRQIAVLMSGGVDSSVSAMLLKDSGWNVLGLTMVIPVAENCVRANPCCGALVGKVCREIGIPHYYVDAREAFRELVIERFRRSYLAGLTPNPCVDCNAELKFSRVWELVEKEFGIASLATGHYARIEGDGDGARLGRAAEGAKDQSYFLYGIARARLGRLRFPVGGMRKKDVRELARKRGLSAAERPESQDLCFAGEGDYRAALGDSMPARKGPITDMSGKVIGEHDGAFRFTIGQRKGVCVAAGVPIFVVAIRPETNTVVVGSREEASRRDVRAVEANVLAPERWRAGERLAGKIRSYGEPSPCIIEEAGEDYVLVRFDEPVFAPTPGQRLVLYDEAGVVAGGGTICDGAADGLGREHGLQGEEQPCGTTRRR